MTIWIATPAERPAAWAYRVIGVRACSCGFAEDDLMLRFSTVTDASDYLDRITDTGLLSAGRIEVYIRNIGWVVTDQEAER